MVQSLIEPGLNLVLKFREYFQVVINITLIVFMTFIPVPAVDMSCGSRCLEAQRSIAKHIPTVPVEMLMLMKYSRMVATNQKGIQQTVVL